MRSGQTDLRVCAVCRSRSCVVECPVDGGRLVRFRLDVDDDLVLDRCRCGQADGGARSEDSVVVRVSAGAMRIGPAWRDGSSGVGSSVGR